MEANGDGQDERTTTQESILADTPTTGDSSRGSIFRASRLLANGRVQPSSDVFLSSCVAWALPGHLPPLLESPVFPATHDRVPPPSVLSSLRQGDQSVNCR